MKQLVIYCALLVTCHGLFADWPEFRGPNADGTISKKLPTEWSEDKNITWRKEIHGRGWSTPAIQNGKIWLTTAAENGTTFSVMCLDYTNGDILLDEVLAHCDNPEPLIKSKPLNSYATCSPVLDEDKVYITFGSYGTFCLNAETFDVEWSRRDIRCSHWRGPASSPIVWQDKLILTFDGADQQFLLALDKASGKTVWRTDRTTDFADVDEKGIPANSGDRRKAYGTPFIVSSTDRDFLISNAAKACWAYDPETGEALWQVKYRTHSPSSRPVYNSATNHIYINTGLGKAEVWAVRFDPEARGDISETHVEWKALKKTPRRSSPVLANGLLYFAEDRIGSCVDPKTGEVVWAERIGGAYSASLLATDEHVYFCDEDGLCTVVKTGEAFDRVAENRLDAGMMASPAVYKDSLLLRTKTHLYRVDD